MKLSDILLLHYAHETAKSVSTLKKQLRAARSTPVPFETTVRVRVPLKRGEDPAAVLRNIRVNAPPGVSIDRMEIDARVLDDDTDYDGEDATEVIWCGPDDL